MITIVDSPNHGASIVADEIEALLTAKPTSALGLATGGTMTEIYRELRRRYQLGAVSFASMSAFLLDEYVGLPADHPESYVATIRRLVADGTDLPMSSVHAPNGAATDLQDESVRYDQAVTDAQLDMQLLGIGRNGHLAFNEPGSPLDSRTRCVALTAETIADNARFFTDEHAVPRRALTQGIATISQARHLVLVAFGAEKSAALSAALEGPVTPAVPAAAVQLHPSVTVVADRAAASQVAMGVGS